MNLHKIKITGETFQELVDKINQNFQTIENSNGGPIGKKGDVGLSGLPGRRGPVGSKGSQGVRGTKWHTMENSDNFPTTDVITGDYSVSKLNGDYYIKLDSGWEKKGTFNFSEGITFDVKLTPYKSDYVVANTKIDILLNSKTNQSLLLSNMDRPDDDLGIQIPVNDTPGFTYPLTQGDDSNNKELYDYKLKIWNSGDSEDDSIQALGRHIHLGNSLAMKDKSGWLKKSGFTFSADLNSTDINTSAEGLEILRISGLSSGNPSHKHRVEFNNTDLWIGNIRANKDGTFSIGHNNSYINTQKIDINGGMKLGYTSINSKGSIRYSDSLGFEGYNGNAWVKFDMTANDVISSMKTTTNNFKDAIIDTSTKGGIVLGDLSIQGSNKSGSIRFKSGIFEGWNGTGWVRLDNTVNFTNTDNSGNGSGGGNVVDKDNNSIATKLAINVNDKDKAGPLIFQGFILYSSDDSIELNQDVLDNKYATIDIKSKSNMTYTDKDGKIKSFNGFDILSDDIGINKTLDDGNLTYRLSLKNTKEFKDAIQSSFDLRSSDGSLIITPPTPNANTSGHWDLKLSNNFGSGNGSNPIQNQLLNGGYTKYNFTTAKYKHTTSTTSNVAYSASYSGYYSYIPFTTKEFDENCNITGTNPLTIKINKNGNGYYRISARVRFKISSQPTGTFASAKLCVVKNNIILDVLNTFKTTDITDSTMTTSKEFELVGSSIVDMSCKTGECDDDIKLAIVTDYGSSGGSGAITFIDSSISMNKITQVTQQSIYDYISNSNVSFKSFTLDRNASTKVSAHITNGIFQLQNGTYTNLSVANANAIIFDVNIAKIRDNISIDLNGLKPAISNIILNGTTFQASANTQIELISGNNISISRTSNKFTFNANSNILNLYSGNVLVKANHSGNIVFGNNFSVTYTGGNVQVEVSPNIKSNISKYTKLFSDYNATLPIIDINDSDSYDLGYTNYEKVKSSSKYAMMMNYINNPIQITNNELGTIIDEEYPNSIVLTPTSTGIYNISAILGFDLVLLYANGSSIYDYIGDTRVVNLGIFKIDESGSYKVFNNTSEYRATLIQTIISSDTNIKPAYKFSKSGQYPFDLFDINNCNRISSSTIVSLTANSKYIFGVYGGRNDDFIKIFRYLNQKATSMEFFDLMDNQVNLKIITRDVDVSITKIN